MVAQDSHDPPPAAADSNVNKPTKAKHPALSVQNVCHWFGANRVLHNVSFEIAAGQIVAIVGPSGCGKSTLLRAILGTHSPKQGKILTDGVPVTGPTRNVGIVYQHYSLYDFLTARQNVAFGLMMDQTKLAYRWFNYMAWRRLRAQHLRAADDLLRKVGLSRAAALYPHEMSGGMRQRVAMAQSLIMNPKVLLLDEPFGALDEATREDLQLMLLQLYEENLQSTERGDSAPHTILIVTHELNEALYVSDRILGLSQFHSEGDLGATIVYDRAAPVFTADAQRDFSSFEAQKRDIRSAVFDADRNQHYSEYVNFWAEHRKQEITP